MPLHKQPILPLPASRIVLEEEKKRGFFSRERKSAARDYRAEERSRGFFYLLSVFASRPSSQSREDMDASKGESTSDDNLDYGRRYVTNVLFLRATTIDDIGVRRALKL